MQDYTTSGQDRDQNSFGEVSVHIVFLHHIVPFTFFCHVVGSIKHRVLHQSPAMYVRDAEEVWAQSLFG